MTLNLVGDDNQNYFLRPIKLAKFYIILLYIYM
jgi:hypothetical protein